MFHIQQKMILTNGIKLENSKTTIIFIISLIPYLTFICVECSRMIVCVWLYSEHCQCDIYDCMTHKEPNTFHECVSASGIVIGCDEQMDATERLDCITQFTISFELPHRRQWQSQKLPCAYDYMCWPLGLLNFDSKINREKCMKCFFIKLEYTAPVA